MKVRSIIKSHGGKSFLTQWILSYFPPNYQEMTYCEPFCGAASVFFNKKPSHTEVLGDLDHKIMNVYFVLKHIPGALLHELRQIELCEENFHRISQSQPLTSVGKAVKEIVLRRWSRGGLKTYFSKSCRSRRGVNENLSAWLSILEEIPSLSRRLQNTSIYTDSYENLFRKFDGDNTLFYCMLPNTKLRTIDEKYLELSNINIGDKLFGNRTVLKKFTREHYGNIIKIKATGMMEYLCVTPEHKIISITGKNGRQEKRSNDELWDQKLDKRSDTLKVGDYVLLPFGGVEKNIQWVWDNTNKKGRKRKPDVKLIDCDELYKFIGYYAAEGHLQYSGSNKTPTVVVLSFGIKEKDTLAQDAIRCAKKCFNVEAKLKPHCPHPTSVQVHIYSTTIATFINNYVNGVATTKKLHQDLMTLPSSKQILILKYWLYGDGGIWKTTRNRSKVTGTTSSIELAQQMLTIAYRCGLGACFKKRQNNFDIYFSSLDATKLGYNIPAKKIRLQRRIINGYILSRIQDIQIENYSGPVIDISVSNDNRFIANNILIHNCDPPYLKSTRTRPKIYDKEMSENDHIKMLEIITKARGKILLSGYPSSLYNEYLKNWNMYTKHVANHSGQNKQKQRRTEVLWTNY